MSLAGFQAGDEEFDLAMLETYTVKQLRAFYRDTCVPTQKATRKEAFQMALRAWAEAQTEEDVEEEGSEDGLSEEFVPSVDESTTAIVPHAKRGSSVSDQGLTVEERREERGFQLQMARLKIEAQQEERRAEREAKQAESERAARQIEAERAEAAAERANKKLLLAHELSLKELEIKARQSESSKLCQHLVDSKLTDPRKIAEEADLWVSTRVSKKASGADTHKGGQGSQQKKERGEKRKVF
ncbi:hypothetical protein NDU88_002096 [Pleurodeles waltl]|uniref:Uncharacterized protein n=1 Tax=Pleurodeles waltl TaxID=8319 RepID=A0AAV7NM34_PLEWA|nr:hypothetical protein NDU88_002096 [Pleurodeles waltl]